jgi:hypothetical protein
VTVGLQVETDPKVIHIGQTHEIITEIQILMHKETAQETVTGRAPNHLSIIDLAQILPSNKLHGITGLTNKTTGQIIGFQTGEILSHKQIVQISIRKTKWPRAESANVFGAY